MNRTSKINFSRNWRRDLETLVDAALRQRVFPGMELLVARADEVFLHETWGRLEIGPEAEALQPGTVYDIASLTKPVATAAVVMVLVEKGRLALEDKAVDFVPEFDAPEKRGITLRHLLTHTSGLPPWMDLYGGTGDRAEALQRLMHATLQYPTGTAMVYGDLNFLILAEIVRRVTGEPLAETFHREIAHPLALHHTTFHPLERRPGAPIAPTQYCTLRQQLLRGVVHDENAHVFGGEGGNAGLFATAGDLHRFARLMLGGGELDGVRVFSRRAVAVMTANHNPRKLPPRGLGWDIKGEGFGYMSCGELMPAGAFGHTGFTGTSLWVEPGSGLVVACLSNRVHISREKNQADMIRFRPRLHNLVVSAAGL